MIELYEIPASGNSYRVRLFCGLIGKPYRSVAITTHGDPRVAALNPLGEAPVLVDGDVMLRDSQAILCYLARRYAPDWLPLEASVLGAIHQWLALAANEIQNGPRMARAIIRGIVPGDLAAAQARAARVLALLEHRLAGRDWLESARPTIADVACYPYVWNADEGGLDLARHPALCAWLRRVAALPGYVRFDG